MRSLAARYSATDAIAIEMIGRKIQPDADRGPEGANRFELKRAHFDGEHVEVLFLPATTSHSGLPMLPQAMVRWPHAFSICASNSVVVVLPFVPVMAMTGTLARTPAQLELADRFDFSRGKILRKRRIRIDARTQDNQIVGGGILLRFRAATSRAHRARADFRSSI